MALYKSFSTLWGGASSNDSKNILVFFTILILLEVFMEKFQLPSPALHSSLSFELLYDYFRFAFSGLRTLERGVYSYIYTVNESFPRQNSPHPSTARIS